MAPQTTADREGQAPLTAAPDTTGLRLTVPDTASSNALALDAEQQSVVDFASRPGHGPVLVLGGPGTGRSTVAVEYAAARIEAGLSPDHLLMLAPTRQAAARLRDALSQRLERAGAGTRAATPVRTWAAYAFDLIRRARVEGFLPTVQRTPRLLSGAEQDTVIAELLETYSSGELQGPDWPADLAEAVPTRGFRQEVRELIDRTSEYGIEPGDLEQLGAQYGRPEWTAAATLLQDYRDRLDLGMAEAFDPAGLITTARRLLEDQPELAELERRRLPVLVVDDLQEATPSIHALLEVLGHGQDTIITANPDTVVQGFRGARPDLLRHYPARLAAPTGPAGTPALAGLGLPEAEHDGGTTVVLTTGHRLTPPVLEAYQRATRRLPADRRTAQLRAQQSPAPTRTSDDAAAESAALVHLVASPAHENQLVLQQILELHHRHEVPFEQIAVMARSGPLVADLGRYLEAEGVPVDRAVTDAVLKTEPAVAPLLTMLRIVATPDADSTLDIDNALELIGGPYGRSTALHLRQLRQRLLAAERAAGGRRTSHELVLAAVEDADLLEQTPVVGDGARRIASMLAAGRQAAAEPAATAETVLWALWNATGTPTRWEDLALTGTGHAARRADRDLDAVVALFQAAERYVDQFPGSSPAAFAEFMESQNLPMDSLAARSRHGETVSVLTPASAAGREWDVVIIAGLQEGIWPNTRLRGQLLGATDLAEIASGRATTASPRTRVAEVRHDELRSFATGISRARHRVIGIGVAATDMLPSDFLDLLQPWHPTAEKANLGITTRPITTVPTPLTAGALVAHLRRDLETIAHHQTEGADRDLIAAALHRLTVEGIAAADPDHWWGLVPPSTEEPLLDPSTRRIRVSPSRVQAALDNPLNWFMDQVGSQSVATDAQSLGTLVHAVAEAYPSGPTEKLMAELERRLPELDLEPGWEADLLHQRARTMVHKFVQYLFEYGNKHRFLVDVEVRFAADLDRDDLHVTIGGIIDRLELDPQGRPYVVDLKTGKSTPSAADVEQHAQLGAYQAAIAVGGLDEALSTVSSTGSVKPHESGGAALVQLGSPQKNVKIQNQEPVSSQDTWAEDQVFAAAAAMVGPQFLAIHQPGRPFCRVPQICPLCSEGRQTTEWTR